MNKKNINNDVKKIVTGKYPPYLKDGCLKNHINNAKEPINNKIFLVLALVIS